MTAAPFWPRRSPAFLRARRAVRGVLVLDDGPRASSPPPTRVVVGLSGGADSLALTAACAAEIPGGVHAVVVDHGLQEGSADVAERAAALARGFGATAEVIRVDVPGGIDGAGEGPEAAARAARHSALHRVAGDRGAPLLLAHTLDDQAETVLLGLARGAGTGALSGMAADRTWDDGVRVMRPFLFSGFSGSAGSAGGPLRRADTEAACAELGVEPWHDPHNADPRYARVRARASVLPMMEELLGPGVAANLARTADLVRSDAAALDEWADRVLADAVSATGPTADGTGGVGELSVGVVVTQPDAVRTRTLKKWAEANGASALTAAHVAALDKLVVGHRGLGPVALPSAETPDQPGCRLEAHRKGGTLAVSRGSPGPAAKRPRNDPQEATAGAPGRKGRPHA
ncbi:tRNA lysidine(34) synthetase TilS [Corynebacterium sp. NPDC060344]|uniref:tRNA lysidine(34) synthetase TilS n=1 Tax=Corynebacterium sp. NPDC060344 TaxID=3347101 RepID=UPI00365A48BC